MRGRPGLLAPLLALAFAPAGADEAGTGGRRIEFPARNCPAAIAGVSVEYEDAGDGAALVFRTERGDVAALRARVERMADMYERGQCGYAGSGPMMIRDHHGGAHRRGMHHGHGTEAMTGVHAARAEVEAVPNGVRLELQPEDPDSLNALRAHLQWMAGRMDEGRCPHMRSARETTDDGRGVRSDVSTSGTGGRTGVSRR